MKNPAKRRLSVAMSLLLLGALPALASATPAAAEVGSPVCAVLLNTTPGIEVDLDNDGNPEFRAPRIYDVVLCTDSASQIVTYPPTVENCSEVPKSVRCMAVRTTVLPAYASAYVKGTLCFSIEGFSRECVPFETPTVDWTQPFTICVGYDLDGGHPCDGSVFSLE